MKSALGQPKSQYADLSFADGDGADFLAAARSIDADRVYARVQPHVVAQLVWIYARLVQQDAVAVLETIDLDAQARDPLLHLADLQLGHTALRARDAGIIAGGKSAKVGGARQQLSAAHLGAGEVEQQARLGRDGEGRFECGQGQWPLLGSRVGHTFIEELPSVGEITRLSPRERPDGKPKGQAENKRQEQRAHSAPR